METSSGHSAQSMMVMAIIIILGLYERTRGVRANRHSRHSLQFIRTCHKLAYAMATCKKLSLEAYDRWLFTTVFLDEDTRRTAVNWMLQSLADKRWHRRALRGCNLENQHPDRDDLREIESELASPADVRHEMYRREGCGFLNQGYSYIENVHKPFGKEEYFGKNLLDDFCIDCERPSGDCLNDDINVF